MHVLAQLEFPTPRRWTYDEYYQLAGMGLFRDQYVVLVDGGIVVMPPKTELHVAAVILATNAAERAFGSGFTVRSQFPLRAGESDEPQPDVAVVAGDVRQTLRSGRPTIALLVIEVGDPTLAYDRREKSGMYGKAGIADYWIVNLVDCVVEVRRNPTADPHHLLGHRYDPPQIFGAGHQIHPLAMPSAAVCVDDLLP